MPLTLPVTNYGNRKFDTPVAENGYTFRTYYIDRSGWFVDIADNGGQEQIQGLRIVAGANSMVKGYGDKFQNEAILAYLVRGLESDTENLGDGLKLLYVGQGDENPVPYEDPMLADNFLEWQDAAEQRDN